MKNFKITATFIIAFIVFSIIVISTGFSDYVINSIARLLTHNVEYCIYALMALIFGIVIVKIGISIYKAFK